MSTTLYTGATPLSRVIPFPSRSQPAAGTSHSGICSLEVAIGLLERLTDFLAVVTAVWLTCWLSAEPAQPAVAPHAANAVWTWAAAFGLLMVLLLEKHGDYRPYLSLLAVRETERLLRVTVVGVALALPVRLATASNFPWKALALGIPMVPLMLAVEKWQLQKVIRWLRCRKGGMRRAVILGTGTLGRRIFSTLVSSPKLGLDPVAFVEACGPIDEPVIFESSYRRKRQARVLPGPVSPRLLRRLNANVLIVAEPELEAQELADIRRDAAVAGTLLYVIPDPFLHDGSSTEYVELDGLMLACQVARDQRPLYDEAKRALDIGLSVLALLLAWPLLAVAALAVKLTSTGPVIFRQQRVGRKGQLFDMYKFRTMFADCNRYACSPISGKDPRITRVGRLLRHTCIDELPQLINVLRGEMSLVGPRPEMPFIVEQYEAVHLKRLTVKPGITGLWQLSADRMSPIHHNISYDIYYARHRNFLMDIAILLHTLVFAFRGV